MTTYDIPCIIGHRGAAKAAPENTLESLREAKRQGATWVEVDAKLTSDNHVILLHDDLVDAEVVRALAEEGEDLVSTSAECRDAFV